MGYPRSTAATREAERGRSSQSQALLARLFSSPAAGLRDRPGYFGHRLPVLHAPQMNRRLYALHRWISAFAFAQLAIWVVSGFFFAVVPMARVKGTPLEGANALPLAMDTTFVAPARILEQLATRGAVTRMELVGTPHGAFYRGRVGKTRFRIDARTGEDRNVDEEEARGIARRDQPGLPSVHHASLVERDAEIEYRDKPLPAWRVGLADNEGTVVYVDAITGEITARRNDVWRIYDFLWSLHIMDYRARERFNHPLLIGAASLGIFTVASGAVLWAVRLVRWIRRRARPAVARARQD